MVFREAGWLWKGSWRWADSRGSGGFVLVSQCPSLREEWLSPTALPSIAQRQFRRCFGTRLDLKRTDSFRNARHVPEHSESKVQCPRGSKSMQREPAPVKAVREVAPRAPPGWDRLLGCCARGEAWRAVSNWKVQRWLIAPRAGSVVQDNLPAIRPSATLRHGSSVFVLRRQLRVQPLSGPGSCRRMSWLVLSSE